MARLTIHNSSGSEIRVMIGKTAGWAVTDFLGEWAARLWTPMNVLINARDKGVIHEAPGIDRLKSEITSADGWFATIKVSLWVVAREIGRVGAQRDIDGPAVSRKMGGAVWSTYAQAARQVLDVVEMKSMTLKPDQRLELETSGLDYFNIGTLLSSVIDDVHPLSVMVLDMEGLRAASFTCGVGTSWLASRSEVIRMNDGLTGLHPDQTRYELKSPGA